jgi:hypothetical protein
MFAQVLPADWASVRMRQTTLKRTESTVATAGRLGRGDAPSIAADRQEICSYVGALADEMARLAYAHQLDALAVACDVVREIAAGNVSSKSRQINGQAGTSARR